MRPVRIQLQRRAKRHLASIKRWSIAHGCLHLVQADFEATIGLLRDHPESGHAFASAYRRALMPRSQNYVYYRFDRETRLLLIVAVWSTARGRPPRL